MNEAQLIMDDVERFLENAFTGCLTLVGQRPTEFARYSLVNARLGVLPLFRWGRRSR